MEEPRALQSADLDRVLPLLLGTASQGSPAEADQVAGFREYLTQSQVQWRGWYSGQRTAPRAVFLSVLIPGATAIVMLPAPGRRGIEHAEQQQLTTAALELLRPDRLHYAQALVEPDVDAQRGLLQRVGFTPLAPLVYLERNVLYPWTDPPAPHEAEWVSYSAETRAAFADTLERTYHGSQDCPELTGLRSIDDILAGHQASGEFDPQLWELARINERIAGCILLARLHHESVAEIVYVGVVPEFRRRAVGALLLRRALSLCRARRIARLTVVADGRNEPARRLYEQFALRVVTRRDAFLYRWH